MSPTEYQTMLLRAAEISELLAKQMNEEMLDLFEEYGDLCARLTRHDMEKCLGK